MKTKNASAFNGFDIDDIEGFLVKENSSKLGIVLKGRKEPIWINSDPKSPARQFIDKLATKTRKSTKGKQNKK